MVVEPVHVFGGDPVFQCRSAACLLNFAGVEEALLDLETGHITDSTRLDVPVTCDAGGVILVEHWGRRSAGREAAGATRAIPTPQPALAPSDRWLPTTSRFNNGSLPQRQLASIMTPPPRGQPLRLRHARTPMAGEVDETVPIRAPAASHPRDRTISSHGTRRQGSATPGDASGPPQDRVPRRCHRRERQLTTRLDAPGHPERRWCALLSSY